MTMTPDEAERRVLQLLDDTDDLVALKRAGESEAATYYLAIAVREHPDEPDCVILMERYAQLAEEWSDMTDTFMKNGVNRRVPADGLGDFSRGLAQAYAGLAAQADAGNVGGRDVNHVGE